jgi:hypothetical protein
MLAKSPSPKAAQSEPASIGVELRDGALSLEVRDAPLGEVFRAIGRAAGFAVVIRGDLGRPTSLSMVDVDLGVALRRLAGKTALLIRYQRGGDAGGLRIDELRLYPRAQAEHAGRQMPDRTVRATVASRRTEVSNSQIPHDLERPQRAARIEKLQRVATLEPGAAVDILTGVLADEDDWAVRREAVTMLGKVGGGRAVDVLETILAEEEPALRLRAVSVVGAIGDDQATQAVGAILLEDRDRRLRFAAALALAREGSDAALRFLEAAASDPDEVVRTAVGRALSRWE